MSRIARYKHKDLNNILGKKIFTNFGNSVADRVEMHVYGGKVLIDSDYESAYEIKNNQGYNLYTRANKILWIYKRYIRCCL